MNALAEELVADEPVVRSRRSPRYWVALVALGLMFLAVTRGPVFWIRIEMDPQVLSSGLLEDVWIQVVFVSSSALVLALAAPAAGVVWPDRLVIVAFSAFLFAVLASSLWSVAVSQTVEQSTMFLLGSVAALAAGAYIRRFDALVALWVAMQVGIVIGAFAWSRDWPRAIDGQGNLAGVYLQKNSLGPVAIMGVAASIVLGIVLLQRRAWLFAPLVFACAGFDAFVWWLANSMTPTVSFVVAAAAVVLLALFVPGRLLWTRRIVGTISFVALAVLTFSAVVYRTGLSGRLGRSSTLSGRTEIWDVVLDYAAERPIGGWGFVAIWTRPEIIESLQSGGRRPVFEAHSGYLEVLLGVGFIGLVLLVVVVVVVIARVVTAMWRAPSVLSAWSFGLVVFAVVASLSESFIGPNVLAWVVFCLATGQAVAICQRTSVGPDDPVPEGAVPDGAVPEGAVPGDHGPDDTPADGVALGDLTPLYIPGDGGASFDGMFDFSFDGDPGSPVEEPRTPQFEPLLDDTDDEFGAIR